MALVSYWVTGYSLLVTEMCEHNSLVEQQKAYYRARAAEYDEWFLRIGRYDRGADHKQQWFAEVKEAQQIVADLAPYGHLLELAGGTGLWTERFVDSAETITVVDSSAEMIAINRARTNSDKAHFIQADIFTWQPDRQYDFVFFGFWLSHVPPERFDDFWALVARCLAPGGRVAFVDSLNDPNSTARDQFLRSADATVVTRRLNNGQEYEIVKVFYVPDQLQSRLAVLGWSATVDHTEQFFLIGNVTRSV